MIFKKTDSHDAKQIINFLDEMRFDIHTTGKSNRDGNLIKNYYNKRFLLASGVQEVVFFQKTQTS